MVPVSNSWQNQLKPNAEDIAFHSGKMAGLQASSHLVETHANVLKFDHSYELKTCQNPLAPYQCWKMAKCIHLSAQSVLSTFQWGGDGQNE